jgi:transglutaminase-like putative cysteine protease
MVNSLLASQRRGLEKGVRRAALRGIALAPKLCVAALASAALAQGGPNVPRLGDGGGSGLTLVATPEWIVENEVPDPSSYEFEAAQGVRYLLFDLQHDATLETPALYTRTVVQATSVVGVPQVSQFTVPFDPGYETLEFHHVRVTRDGVVEDRHESANYDVLRREQLLELQMVTGLMTASLRLNDIRVGDIVDIAFSTSGVPTAFDGRDARVFPLALGADVERLALRSHWPQGATVALRGEAGDFDEVRSSSGSVLYALPARRSPAAKPESYAPTWEPVVPFLTASSYSDWAEVAAWGRPLFEPAPDAQIIELAEQIRAANPDPKHRIVAALRFVQEEIRYFALTLGEGGYVPTSTAETIRTRTGDCKAKTLLLLSLLAALEVEAHAVLVNVTAGRALPLYAPSPAAFNHVMVRVHHEARDYWLDPTTLFQGGDLDVLTQPEMGYALPLDGQTQDLVAMPRRERATPDVVVRDTYDISGGPETPGRLRRETTYTGRMADGFRAVLATTPSADLDEAYSQTVAARYSGAEIVAPSRVSDDIEANAMTTVVEFVIAEPFKVDGQNPSRRTFDYRADLILSPVPDPGDNPESRRWPVMVLVDGTYRHEIVINLPDTGRSWSLEVGDEIIENSAFRFRRILALDGRTYTLTAELNPLAETVAPGAIAAVLDDQERMLALTRRQVWVNRDARPFLPNLELPKIEL